MGKLVVRSGFYEELNVPTPHLRNAHFFITRLYKIGQKPKFRQCYFLGNIKNIKIYILRHILVPVSEDPGEAAGYRPVAARLHGTQITFHPTLSYFIHDTSQSNYSKYSSI